MNFAEEFAQKRYLKKMELPDSEKANERKATCWSDWISHDQNLPTKLCLPPGNWYKARLTAHEALRHFRIGEMDVTNGSEYTPTRGLNSLESKLARSSWDITRCNVDLFTDLSLNDRCIKSAVRKRFSRRIVKMGLCPKHIERQLWKTLRSAYPSSFSNQKVAREVWRAKVVFVTNYVEGSRFSTVRKNNEKDRPINVEPLCNILVQRAIGNGLRKLLKEFFGIDLDNDQIKHRYLIALQKATIDLKNASDSVSRALCDFALPRWFRDLLEQCRSQLILGPDNMFYDVRKISSMGNGFTFELMTFLLVCLGRVHDCDFSVYGDDIIVSNSSAHDLIKDLEAVGFIVNKDKSFIDSKFRESCGANYHDDFGYIESFDFEYPLHIHDCVTLFNKSVRLAVVYDSFKKLKENLLRAIPLALRGAHDHLLVTERARGPLDSERLSGWFKSGFHKGDIASIPRPENWSSYVWEFKIRNHIDFDEPSRFFYTYEFRQDLASDTLMHLSPRRHWAKYFMYLRGGRRTKDALRDSGDWVRVLSIEIGQSTYRWKDLLQAVKTVE